MSPDDSSLSDDEKKYLTSIPRVLEINLSLVNNLSERVSTLNKETDERFDEFNEDISKTRERLATLEAVKADAKLDSLAKSLGELTTDLAVLKSRVMPLWAGAGALFSIIVNYLLKKLGILH